MKELEIARFSKKKQQHFTENNSTNNQKEKKGSQEKKVQVPLPSNAFGHSVVDKSITELSKEYGNHYYENPQNFKQKASNSFVLKMLSAVSHRFENKSKLYTWGREERDNRWNTMFKPCTI